MLSNRRFIFVLVVSLIIFTRFFKLNWGDNFFFNPDENNMATSVMKMNPKNLDPHFYAYGQFPLYLTLITTPIHDFKSVVLTLRFWSALFSSASLFLFYLISKRIFKESQYSLIFVLFLTFTPGLIQMSHFGTTESILLFVFAANILLSFKIFDNLKIKYFILASIVSGIGLATKISSLILTTPIFLSLLFLLIKKRKIWQLFFGLLVFCLITVLIGILFSPYNLINLTEFISTMKYEVGVATGEYQVFYTRQFIGSIPYLFQIQKIFPYANGIPLFILGLVGFGIIIKSFIDHRKSNPYLLLILFPSLIFFIYQGQLFTKWTRFISPIFFIFPLLSMFVFQKIKSKNLFYSLTILCLLPGIYFFKTYLNQDIRVVATNWINENISHDSRILSEGGNVVDIPMKGHYDVVNFDFYNHDEDVKSPKKLNQLINQSEYIIVPSRRIFKNQNNPRYPRSQQYYQRLFSGKLNFKLIKTISRNNSLFLNPENAEETWSVFDNPVIRIYEKADNKDEDMNYE